MVLDDMSKVFIGLGTIAIVAIVMFMMISEGKTQLISQSAACENTSNLYNASSGACEDPVDNTVVYGLSGTWNATGGIQSAGEDAVDWLPIIIITIIGGLLIGLVAFFRGRR